MEKIEERADELRKMEVSRKKAYELLKMDYPECPESDIEKYLKDWEDPEPSKEKIELEPPPLKVRVVNFDMPFMDMVVFMVKWAFAMLPAAFIIWVIHIIFTAIVATGILM